MKKLIIMTVILLAGIMFGILIASNLRIREKLKDLTVQIAKQK